MPKICTYLTPLFILSLGLPVQLSFARDDVGDYSVANALASDQARSKLNGVKFYFGTQEHGKVNKRYGMFRTNQKSSSFGKSDQAACEWVFLSALIQLKKKAMALGGNSVINIKSTYKNNLTSSEETFKCGAGAIIAGVGLEGEVVSIK